MKKNSEFSGNGQGPGPVVEDPIKDLPEVPTVEAIEKWLVRDFSVVSSLFQALLTDKELRLHMATFLQGRYSNAKNRPVVDPRQADLFPKS